MGGTAEVAFRPVYFMQDEGLFLYLNLNFKEVDSYEICFGCPC